MIFLLAIYGFVWLAIYGYVSAHYGTQISTYIYGNIDGVCWIYEGEPMELPMVISSIFL